MKKFVVLIVLVLLGVGLWFWKGKKEIKKEVSFPNEYHVCYTRVYQNDNFMPDGSIGMVQSESAPEELYFTSQKRRTVYGGGEKVAILRKDLKCEYLLDIPSKTYMKKDIVLPEDVFDVLLEAKWKPFGTEDVNGKKCNKYKYAAVRKDRAGFLATCWMSPDNMPALVGFHMLEGINENERYPANDQIIKITSFQKGAQDPKLFEIPADFKEVPAPPVQIPNIPKVGPQPGDQFTLDITGISGKKYTLKDFQDTSVVLEWVNYDCPYTKKFYDAGEIQAIQKEYGSKIRLGWFTICSSPKDKEGYRSPEKIAEFQKQYGSLATDFIIDDKGELAKKYNVQNTPHVVVLNHGVLVYSGAIDVIATTEVQHVGKIKNFLRLALQAVIEGRWPITVMTSTYGTPIPQK